MDMVSKEQLIQYKSLKSEIEKMKIDIKKTEDSIENLVREGVVEDKVYGGLGGIQGFKIEGFPVAIYEKRRNLLRKKVDRLSAKENELLELVENMETLVDNIPVSRDRVIFRALYFEGKTQQQIADELHIDRSLVSKTISKYL